MRTNRWTAGLAAGAAMVGVLLAGSGTALADDGTPPPAPTADAVCEKRIPTVLARIEKLTTRINGDAEIRGSTAWLQTKAEQARAAGRTARADLLEARAAARPQRLEHLATLKANVEDVQAENCAA